MSNLLYGLRPHGRFIHAANIMDDGSNVTPDDLIGYLPEVYDVIAVSYTHLTLPTICSV